MCDERLPEPSLLKYEEDVLDAALAAVWLEWMLFDDFTTCDEVVISNMGESYAEV